MSKIEKLVGKKFSKLRVLGISIDRKHLRVRCDCGNIKLVLYSNLVQGRTKGCGCSIGGKVIHSHCIGKTDAEYKMWMEARKRAREKGIKFSITLDDIIIPTHCPVFHFRLKRNSKSGPSDPSPSLDRFNPKLGYTKKNIWVISVKANRAKNNLSAKEVGMLYATLRKKENENRKP